MLIGRVKRKKNKINIKKIFELKNTIKMWDSYSFFNIFKIELVIQSYVQWFNHDWTNINKIIYKTILNKYKIM